MRQINVILTALILCSLLATGYAVDTSVWPAFRGPEFTGLAPAANPPTTWSETQNIKWKFKLTGDGSDSSPIVWKDKIFFQTAVKTDTVVKPVAQPAADQQTPPSGDQQGPPPGDRQGPPPGQGGQPPRGGRPGGRDSQQPTNLYKFNVVCLDRATGKLLWEKTVHEALPIQAHHPDHGFASFSPVTDGKYVWANFGSYGLYCVDFDGKLIWSKELVPMKNRFGEAGSLALAGDAVIVVADNDQASFIYAFNKNTGVLLWQKPRDEKFAYAVPVVTTLNGKLQIITGASKVRSYDAKTGDLLWESDKSIQVGIPTPIVGFGKLFCGIGGRGAGAIQAVNLNNIGTIADANDIAWQSKDVIPHVASPMLYGKRLYVVSPQGGGPNSSPKSVLLACFDAETGKPFYVKQPLEAITAAYASPVGAADRVYFAGRDGNVCVIKNSDTFELLAANKLDDGFDCTPALVDNEIILKGKQYVYCIAEMVTATWKFDNVTATK